MVCPDGECASVISTQLCRNTSHMMDKAQVFNGVDWLHNDLELGLVRKYSSILPHTNVAFDFWCPHQVGPLRSDIALLRWWHIHVWTAAVVLSAVLADGMLIEIQCDGV